MMLFERYAFPTVDPFGCTLITDHSSFVGCCTVYFGHTLSVMILICSVGDYKKRRNGRVEPKADVAFSLNMKDVMCK